MKARRPTRRKTPIIQRDFAATRLSEDFLAAAYDAILAANRAANTRPTFRPKCKPIRSSCPQLATGE